MLLPPKINQQKFAELLQEIRDLVPFYTPEWYVPQENDSGSALLKIFAHMVTGTLEQFNHVSDKNFLAFLNTLGVQLLPAQQSRVPVMFYLSKGATQPVVIPANTQVSAQATQRTGDAIIFETETQFTVTPANLVEAYSVNGSEDSVFSAPTDFLTTERKPVLTRLVYNAKQNDTSLFLDTTTDIKSGDILKIKKISGYEFVEVDKIYDKKVSLTVKIETSYDAGTLVEKEVNFELFQGKNKQEHILYLGKYDIFNVTSNTQIILELPNISTKLADSKLVQWEYWSEDSWHSFDKVEITNNQLVLDKNNNNEIEDSEINGIKSRWIRCRDLGKVNELQDIKLDAIKVKVTRLGNDNAQADSQPPASPEMVFFDYCLTFNNLQYQDKTEESHSTNKHFQPFQPLEDEHQALYLGFDAPPQQGLISIFFALEIQAYTQKNRPRLRWEYYRRQQGRGEWMQLEVQDQTIGITQSGTIEFIGSSDLAQTSYFNKSLYWIRVVDIDDKFKPEDKIPDKATAKQFAPAPKIRGIYLNSTWANQAETINNEIVGASNGEANQIFTLSKTPVISEEIWVQELSALSSDDRKELLALAQQGEIQVMEIKNNKQETIEFWVKWAPVEELLDSKASDRHYHIDRTFGQLKFGDSIEGAIPPIGKNNIKANYKVGGGQKGNIQRFEITNLRSSIAYINRVTNPEPAEGGTDTELLEQALKRGPQMLKHRNRAVTASDFENLTYQASRSIARVKCLSNFNEEGKYELGWVTLIVIPSSSSAKPQPSLLLRQQVEKYLQDHTANVITSPQHLRVSGPIYIEVTIKATLVAIDFEAAPSIEFQAIAMLNTFLHPLTGGNNYHGWEFGRLPCLSDFYALLGSIPGLDHVEYLTMNVNHNDINLPPYALVSSGKHQINVKANVTSPTIA